MSVALLLVSSVACSPDRPPAPLVTVSTPDAVGTWGFGPIAGEVLSVGMAPLRVLAPVTFEDASLEMEHGRLDLLTTRASMLACPTCRVRADVPSYGGYGGSSCSLGPWPPPGYGPTLPIAGLELTPEDQPSLVLYLRPVTPEALTKAVLLRYRDSAGRRHELRITNERVEVEPPATPRGDSCTDSVWFGGTRNPDVGRIRTAPPAPAS